MTEIHTAVTQYTVSVFPSELHDNPNTYSYLIRVEESAPGRWAVRRMGRCLNANGEWEYESIPSERKAKWLKKFRHEKETALRLAAEAAPDIRVNGMSAIEMLAWVQREDGERR